MAGAALTPRVRVMVLCDGLRESAIESGVFNLKGVRQNIKAESFPAVGFRLRLFFVLFSPRPGEFPAYIRVVSDKTDKTIFHGQVGPAPAFHGMNDVVNRGVRIKCRFPEPGRYTAQLWFFQEQGNDVLKGELPFSVTQESE